MRTTEIFNLKHTTSNLPVVDHIVSLGIMASAPSDTTLDQVAENIPPPSVSEMIGLATSLKHQASQLGVELPGLPEGKLEKGKSPLVTKGATRGRGRGWGDRGRGGKGRGSHVIESLEKIMSESKFKGGELSPGVDPIIQRQVDNLSSKSDVDSAKIEELASALASADARIDHLEESQQLLAKRVEALTRTLVDSSLSKTKPLGWRALGNSGSDMGETSESLSRGGNNKGGSSTHGSITLVEDKPTGRDSKSASVGSESKWKKKIIG